MPICHFQLIWFSWQATFLGNVRHVFFRPVCVLSCSVMSDSLWHYRPWSFRILCLWDFPGKKPEWVAISCSRGSSQPRDQTPQVLAGGFFTTDPPRKHLTSIAMINLSHLRFFSEQRWTLEYAFQRHTKWGVYISMWERDWGMWQRDRPSENSAHK